MDTIGLTISAFVAGLLTFLAPCTLPLVPGYLGFISGVSLKDIDDPAKGPRARHTIFTSALLFVTGFSAVFILFGTLLAFGGLALSAYRPLLQKIGGTVIIFFGLYMTGALKLPFLMGLEREKRFPITKHIKPGAPFSSLLFGVSFALGWTPCIGPILGSILTLAAASATVWKGAALLAVFSTGLSLPFLLIALLIGSASHILHTLERILPVISVVGGCFLVFLGILLLTDSFGTWVSFFYQFFQWIHYEKILDYL